MKRLSLGGEWNESIRPNPSNRPSAIEFFVPLSKRAKPREGASVGEGIFINANSVRVDDVTKAPVEQPNELGGAEEGAGVECVSDGRGSTIERNSTIERRAPCPSLGRVNVRAQCERKLVGAPEVMDKADTVKGVVDQTFQPSSTQISKRPKREKKIPLQISGQGQLLKQSGNESGKEAVEGEGGAANETDQFFESALNNDSLFSQGGNQRQVGKNQTKEYTLGNMAVSRSEEISLSHSCTDFLIPVSKRPKLHGDMSIEEKFTETKIAALKPQAAGFFQPISRKIKSQKIAQSENPPVHGEAHSSKPQAGAVKDRKTSSTQKHTPTSISDSSAYCSGDDLRFKAVLAAQENARLSAGKPTHPFFARQKKPTLKVSNLLGETPVCQVDGLHPSPPTHVTQWTEEGIEVKWEGWDFVPLVSNDGCKEEDLVRQVEQSGCRLQDHLLISTPSVSDHGIATYLQTGLTTSFLTEATPVSSRKHEETFSEVKRGTAEIKALQDLLKYLQHLKMGSHNLEENLRPREDTGKESSLENLRERLRWYKACHDSIKFEEVQRDSQVLKKNPLWTDLYQPKSSKEVCGNVPAVEFLSGWFHKWQRKVIGQLKSGDTPSEGGGDGMDSDDDSDTGWFEEDSDKEGDLDDEARLHNTLLVTGPAGCGKSAAIFACAAEHGFTVLEVNASDCRNGALIKQKFGEATESHGLSKWSNCEPAVLDSSQGMPKSIKKTDSICPQVPPTGQTPSQQVHQKEITETREHASKSQKIARSSFNRFVSKGGAEDLNPSEDQLQIDCQRKRMTVLLFEDVDINFEEDKGFLSALVQLAKTTKRPIVLTSNRLEPGLPQVLEKVRIKFNYPGFDELVLHSSMVCIAEGLSYSPWVLDRLVDSCQCDLRKVMMALQFWGQGNLTFLQSSPLQSLSQISGNATNERESKKSLCLSTKRFPSMPVTELDRSHGPTERKLLRQWESDARYLFELDVHHLILPNVIIGSFPCPLSLEVAQKICVAASEFEKYEEQVAVKVAQEQGLALQAEVDASEAAKKALKKAKDAMRRAALLKRRSVEGGAMITGFGSEVESVWDEKRFLDSPPKNVREAKVLARSPLKPKILKSRRTLLLCDSDNDESGKSLQVGDIDKGETFIPQVASNLCSEGTVMTGEHDSSELTPANIVPNDLEDKDIVYSAACEVGGKMKRRRRRLLKDSCEVSPPLTSFSDPVDSGCNAAVEEVQSAESSCLVHVSLVPPSCQNVQSAHLEKATCEKLLSSDHHPVRQLTDRSVGNSLDIDVGGMLTIPLKIGAPEKTREVSNSETGERHQEHNLHVGVDKHLKYFVAPIGGEAANDSSIINLNVLPPDSRELGNDVDKIVEFGDSRRGVASREEATSDTLNVNHHIDGEVGQLGSSMKEISNPLVGEFRAVDFENSEWSPADECWNRNVDIVKDKPSDRTTVSFIDPVKEVWRNLRDSPHSLQSLLEPAHSNGLSVISSLANLVDLISVSDVISSSLSETCKDAWSTFNGTANGLFEGNIGHCSSWESSQEIASQLVHRGLHHSLTVQSTKSARPHKKLPVIFCILTAARDPSAVGKCMTTWGGMDSSHVLKQLKTSSDGTFSRGDITRQAARQEWLEEVVAPAMLPRGRIGGAGLHDYAGYLARMSKLEELRRNSINYERSRSRRFQHHLSSSVKSLSESDITELYKLSRFGKSRDSFVM